MRSTEPSRGFCACVCWEGDGGNNGADLGEEVPAGLKIDYKNGYNSIIYSYNKYVYDN